MLKKHLLLQLTATHHTGGVTKGKLHIFAAVSGSTAGLSDSTEAEDEEWWTSKSRVR